MTNVLLLATGLDAFVDLRVRQLGAMQFEVHRQPIDELIGSIAVGLPG